MKILVTGTAGFIGYHLTNQLIARGDEVVGLDIINDYYDIRLKFGRLAEAGIEPFADIPYNTLIYSKKHSNYKFIRLKLEDSENIQSLFASEKFDKVCNLAAQAGVRYSLTHPQVYIDSNITGFLSILEACRHYNIQHLVYASSSSVYGLNAQQPLSAAQSVDHPISLYAASKKANELMAHTYSSLFQVPTTGLRFFSAYGPWGRPDMALFIFTKSILEDKPIDIYNYGEMLRDFTYVDDIVEGIVRVIDNAPTTQPDWDAQNPDPASSKHPYKIYNIGNSSPVRLMDFVEAIEQYLGKKATKNMLPMQPGDVAATCADVTDLANTLHYKPSTSVFEGMRRFIDWYRWFYNV